MTCPDATGHGTNGTRHENENSPAASGRRIAGLMASLLLLQALLVPLAVYSAVAVTGAAQAPKGREEAGSIPVVTLRLSAGGVRFVVLNPGLELEPARLELEPARLEVYDLAGRRVFEGGFQGTLQWDLQDNAGRPVANGVYLYVIVVRAFDGTRAWMSPVGKLVVRR